jgi:hypothetical protein
VTPRSGQAWSADSAPDPWGPPKLSWRGVTWRPAGLSYGERVRSADLVNTLTQGRGTCPVFPVFSRERQRSMPLGHTAWEFGESYPGAGEEGCLGARSATSLRGLKSCAKVRSSDRSLVPQTLRGTCLVASWRLGSRPKWGLWTSRSPSSRTTAPT